jgi:organic hydroperoxide reductase OsmC/OhrA
MDKFPHHYAATVTGKDSGAIIACSRQCPPLSVAEPEEFDGTGEHWSPEQIFVAMVADCLILTFRSIANASKFSWADIECKAQGVLERVEGVNKFTQVDVDVNLVLNSKEDQDKGLRLLTKAENQCLVKNSINAQTNFKNTISFKQ